ncbi:aminotransferase class V-fold PLP-dependent enzyme [Angustibacter aerolatus]
MTDRTQSHPPETPVLRRVREGVIGAGLVLDGPYGARSAVYADWTATGRSIDLVEDWIRAQVLPRYANTHTESSATGAQTGLLREDARAEIAAAVGADAGDAVVFCGSGATAAIHKLVEVLGLRIPSAAEDRWHLEQHVPADERPLVLLGPYEHHSNELPWRESLADVVTIPEDATGRVDLDRLEDELRRAGRRPLVVGSFSAASNVTGILADTRAVSRLLHRYGALACWDYATAAPYTEIEMHPADDPLAAKDAVFMSPHKLPGGPGTPGVLVVRASLLRNRVPAVVGGGTVSYVGASQHDYVASPHEREEGGTPAIVESVRAGLAFRLKRAIGVDVITARERHHVERALQAWADHPAIEVLGDQVAERLPVISLLVRHPEGRLLHHEFVVTLLSDLFGVQARGGCSCAAPYGHRLLGIDDERSQAYRAVVTDGCSGIKPGWVRLSLGYLMSAPELEHVLEAVLLVAEHGHRLLADYAFEPATGRWRHRRSDAAAPVRLTDLTFDADGTPRWPTTAQPPAPGSLVDQRASALDRLLSAPAVPDDGGAAFAHRLGAEVERLRWFALPAACLAPLDDRAAAVDAGPTSEPGVELDLRAVDAFHLHA